MNADERQALRKRHADLYGFCVYCFVPDTYNDKVGEVMPAPYPCDTIKVLDAWEADKCDHKTVLNGVEKTWWFSCPKCNQTL
jgi:hypothetical protein